MASGKNFVQAYGIKSGLLTIGPMTQVLKVDPTAGDVGVGTIAVNEALQSAWILVGFSAAGAPVYKQIDNGGGTGVFAQLTVTPGPTSITGITGITGATTIAGDTSINNNINSNTSLNTGTSTGTVLIGNVANGGIVSILSSDNIAIESSLAADITAVDITASGAASGITLTTAADGTISATSGTVGTAINSTGAISLISSQAAAGAITLDANVVGGGIDTTSGTGGTALNSTGVIALSSSVVGGGAITLDATDAAGGITATVGTGNFNVTDGSVKLTTAATGYILSNNIAVLSGTNSPDTVVTAEKGSLFLRDNGSAGGVGTSNRVYINTDGATAWTAIVTEG